MKKILYIITLILLLSFGCYANSDQSFIIQNGNEPSQIGFSYAEGYSMGAIAIAENNGKIFILDDQDLKINVYTYAGEYKQSIYLPKELGFYYDLAVNSQGDIFLLTDKGIFIKQKNKFLEKKYDLPSCISGPMNISIDEKNNVIFTGMCKPGSPSTTLSGIFTAHEGFKELKLNGYDIFTNYQGLIGLKNSKNTFTIYGNGKICNKISLDSDMIIPFGIGDKMEVYCAELTRKEQKIYKFAKNGTYICKQIEFSSSFIEDDIDVLRTFKLTKEGNIIYLEANENGCKVSIISGLNQSKDSVYPENLLTIEYAKHFHQFPSGKELSQAEQQKEIVKANSLLEEGFSLYKTHNDQAAISKYEEALTHYASAEIYYRYGNSLSNIPQLEDAVQAYQIALELNYDKPGLVYYNIACAYSRMNQSKEAFANLELALNNGYKSFDHIEKDEDLVWLRSQPEWKDWWAKHQ